jgi:hypothetical protein
MKHDSTAIVIDPMDRMVHGAKAIAEVLDLRFKSGKNKGKPNERRAYYLLVNKFVDADKLGVRHWASTPRRLLKIPRADINRKG